MTRAELEHAIRAACEAHDLAASKLAAFRDRDRDFVRVLLAEGMVKPRVLAERVRRLPVPQDERERLVTWIRRTAGEIGSR